MNTSIEMPVENTVAITPPVTTVAEDPIPMLQRRWLCAYLFVCIIGFILLVLPARAGVSVPIFVIIQGFFLWRIFPRKKHLLMLIPIFILALNSFISANPMWRGANLVVSAVLFSAMQVWALYGFSFQDKTHRIILHILCAMARAFAKVKIPFKWGMGIKVENKQMALRVAVGIGASVPVLIFLVIMLSAADAIFSNIMQDIFWGIVFGIYLGTIPRIIFGCIAGLYLFGVTYAIVAGRKTEKVPSRNGFKPIIGDCVILNIIMASTLAVYTLFVAIQFRYLFAPSTSLPYGLTFVTYARRGFFELLFLTGVNIAFILVAVGLTKTQSSRGAKATKWLCLYLCSVTVVLLVSSFYRMWLYSSDDGLTTMRLLVIGFLAFEMIGLIFTFMYIVRPKFNIVLVYALVALSYFLVLNIVPIDRIIAHEQINRYFAGERTCVAYVFTLSADAAPEIERLIASENEETVTRANLALVRMARSTQVSGWRQWNLSRTWSNSQNNS